jgi:para-nitrobenzyl esterase
MGDLVMSPRALLRAAWCVAACAGMSSALAQTGVAHVTGGDIQGVVQGKLVVYRGVPFAAPPVGDLRWRDPQPARPWKGLRAAKTFTSPCMQAMSMLVPPGPSPAEDCLYLNVWAPTTKPQKPLPVMVWIHGGAFTTGAPTAPFFDGTHFANRGVILVSIAYRLGPLGFLAHPELSRESGRGSGNYGLKDQITALKWVQENAAAFGGDKSVVTIFGQSAGAGSVSFLAASPLAKGLFQRAIAQSGGSFAPATGAGAMVSNLAGAEAEGQRALAELGATTIAAARMLPADQIIKMKARFGPTLDGSVLPNDPYDLYEAHGQNDTPVLLGYNSNEGAMGSHPTTPAEFEAQIRGTYGTSAEAILAVYPHASDAAAQRSSRDVFRDSAFGWNAWIWARLQSKHGKGKVYSYYFDQVAPRDSMFYSPDGAVHTGEVPYVFGTLDAPTAYTDQDRALSDAMQSYWVNFARTGNPNGPGLPDWPAFTADSLQLMTLRGTAALAPMPNMEKVRAFDAYYQAQRKASAP